MVEGDREDGESKLGDSCASDDIDRLLDSCAEIFDVGNTDFNESKVPSTSEFKTKPDGWESTTKAKDGSVWDISQRKRTYLSRSLNVEWPLTDSAKWSPHTPTTICPCYLSQGQLSREEAVMFQELDCLLTSSSSPSSDNHGQLRWEATSCVAQLKTHKHLPKLAMLLRKSIAS
ncbi:hypothetical protein HPP92_016282 [Vanilla planifolia]|uniref:Uncharacterized protein n=1 Tax=Vanilla planifolia TaxID=51239 RepID=A0A835QIV2_VANPL|nr:hypothetical protein HPP92_016282 [Vanilla planifolia]